MVNVILNVTRRIQRSGRWGALLVAVSAMAVVAVGAAPASPAAATPTNYVALGDSYTAGAGILPLASGASPLCLQSARNYPHLVAAKGGERLTDVSCSAATSGDMTSSQYPGVAPQFDALSPSTNLVTVGIGGNDNNLFISALVSCGIVDLPDVFNIGAPCQALFGNTFSNDIASDAPAIAGVLRGIHSHSPAAKVLVVGYPDILPQHGNCYPTLPLTTGDTAYLNAVEKALDAMLATEAAANGATFVDTFTGSIGHDACKPADVRWVNPIIATNGGVSVHPDPAGEAHLAQFVEAAL